MKLVIFTTKYDKSEKLLTKEVDKSQLSCRIYFYEDLVYQKGRIFSADQNPVSVNRDDKIILRDPYNAKYDYSFFTRKLLQKYYKNIALDRECYKQFPFYEDKLFQYEMFTELGIAAPETLFGQEVTNFIDFPVIVKPKIGSRSRGIHIIGDEQNLKEFFANKDPLNYLVQKYYKAEKEYRLLILKHKILGVVEKSIHLKTKGRIGVRINKMTDSLPQRIQKDSINVSKHLKADFIGVDVIAAENGNYYFLEANLSPQFTGFTKVSKINVAEKVIQAAIS
jgi:hypothetical protein